VEAAINPHKPAPECQYIQIGRFFSTFCSLPGGDKPRHYKLSFTEQVGVGFIPTRELAGTQKKLITKARNDENTKKSL
jgi:hypothetical protein